LSNFSDVFGFVLLQLKPEGDERQVDVLDALFCTPAAPEIKKESTNVG